MVSEAGAVDKLASLQSVLVTRLVIAVTVECIHTYIYIHTYDKYVIYIYRYILHTVAEGRVFLVLQSPASEGFIRFTTLGVRLRGKEAQLCNLGT